MITISIQAEPDTLEKHLAALGFIRAPIGVGEKIESPLKKIADSMRDGTAKFIKPGDAIAYANSGAMPEASLDQPSALAQEMDALEQPQDFAAPPADPGAKRQPGQPSPGRKRRTKEEMEEDYAYLKVHSSFPMAQAISTGGEREEPTVEEVAAANAIVVQDAADEAAETAQRASGPPTLEDLRAAVARYVAKHGPQAGVQNVQKIIGCPLIAVPEGEIAAAISRVDHATATGQISMGAANGEAQLTTDEVVAGLNAPPGHPAADRAIAALTGTKDSVVAALKGYGQKFDGTLDPEKMTYTYEDIPKLFTKEFGKGVTGIGSMPKGKDGLPLAEACGRIAAAIAAATRDNPFKRTAHA